MMSPYENRITWKFWFLAGFYDLFDIPLRLNPKANPRLALAKKIPNRTNRVLDVCVGTANSAIAVAEANDQNEIVGIDLSPDMIAVGEGKIRRRSLRNISLRRMDATRMSFQDGEFDVVMISFALHELEHELMMRILSEMNRVVKEKGLLHIIDYELEETLIKRLILSANLKLFEPAHMQRFLKYDWKKLLAEASFGFTGQEKYLFSKLISAVKEGDTLA